MKKVVLSLLLLLAASSAWAQKPPINGVAGPTSSAQLKSIITDATGSGALNFGPTGGVTIGATISGPCTNGFGLFNNAGTVGCQSGAGTGTVTTVSIVTANGFSGSIANATTTPAITVSTSINAPVLAGNGTAISAATTTGSGSTAVLATSPTLVTPALGVATATSLAIGGATLGANALAVTGHLLLEGVTSTGAQGTGALVFATSPTLTTPVIGAATGTSLSLTGADTALSGTTLTAGGSTTVPYKAYTTSQSISWGTGAPTFSAAEGSIYGNATNGALYTNTSGSTTWTQVGAAGGVTVGSTTVGSGTTTRVLFDNAGVLGEYAISGTVNVCMTTNCVMTTPNLGTPSAINLTNATAGSLALTGLATQAANTWNMNSTSGAASPTAVSVPNCGTTGALTYTQNGGASALSCTSIPFTAMASNTTVGFTNTPNSIGTVSSGTVSLVCTSGNRQFLTNNGAFTLATQTSDCPIAIYVLNGASAGAITFSGFTNGSSTGDPLTTVNTSKFFIFTERINGVSTYVVHALQ